VEIKFEVENKFEVEIKFEVDKDNKKAGKSGSTVLIWMTMGNNILPVAY
jgi:hypothetical protein